MYYFEIVLLWKGCNILDDHTIHTELMVNLPFTVLQTKVYSNNYPEMQNKVLCMTRIPLLYFSVPSIVVQ